jgi:hypothetical protein
MRHYNRSPGTSLFTQNFLWIGYQAWQGYLNSDRGLIVISSEVDLLDDSDDRWSNFGESSLNFRYIPQAQLSIYLQEWLVDSKSIAPIIGAVANYQPQIELVFAIESGISLDIGWCQRLKILPPDCYQQIWRRSSEFQLGFRN